MSRWFHVLIKKTLAAIVVRVFCYIWSVNNVLNILAKHDKEFQKMVKSFGVCEYPEDIVQDFYIKVYKNKITTVIEGDKPNFNYCWMVLRNLYYDTHKKKIQTQNIDELLTISFDDDLSKELEKERIQQSIEKEMQNWEWFDQQLFLLYLRSGKSMRELELETKISLTSIFHTIKKCKQKLKKWQKEHQEVSEIL